MKKPRQPRRKEMLVTVGSRPDGTLSIMIGITRRGLASLTPAQIPASGPADAPVLIVSAPPGCEPVTEVVLFAGEDLATLERVLTDNDFLVSDDDE